MTWFLEKEKKKKQPLGEKRASNKETRQTREDAGIQMKTKAEELRVSDSQMATSPSR